MYPFILPHPYSQDHSNMEHHLHLSFTGQEEKRKLCPCFLLPTFLPSLSWDTDCSEIQPIPLSASKKKKKKIVFPDTVWAKCINSIPSKFWELVGARRTLEGHMPLLWGRAHFPSWLWLGSLKNLSWWWPDLGSERRTFFFFFFRLNQKISPIFYLSFLNLMLSVHIVRE